MYDPAQYPFWPKVFREHGDVTAEALGYAEDLERSDLNELTHINSRRTVPFLRPLAMRDSAVSSRFMR